jgi:hypothetical protein
MLLPVGHIHHLSRVHLNTAYNQEGIQRFQNKIKLTNLELFNVTEPEQHFFGGTGIGTASLCDFGFDGAGFNPLGDFLKFHIL